MPQSHYIENLLDLKDTNIEVLADEPIQIVTIHKKQCKVIFAKLSPPIIACHACGALADRVIKHGTKTSMVKINAVVGYDTYLRIKKQRYFCKECHATFTAQTNLVDQGCHISRPLKTAILMEAQEVCSEKSLAKRFGVSHQTVHRLIHQKVFQLKTTYDYLPSFLGIDEFKSTRSASGAMSFILGDAYNKELIDIVEDRRLPSLIRYFHRYDLAVRQRVRGVVIDMYDPYIQLASSASLGQRSSLIASMSSSISTEQ